MNIDKFESNMYNISLYIEYDINNILIHIPIIKSIYLTKLGNELYYNILDTINTTYLDDDIIMVKTDCGYGIEVKDYNNKLLLYVGVSNIINKCKAKDLRTIHILFKGEHSNDVSKFINSLQYSGKVILDLDTDPNDPPIKNLIKNISDKFSCLTTDYIIKVMG